MRAIRGCRHYFFCAAWGPWPPCPPPRHPGAPGRKTPRGTPPRVDKGPCRQRGQSGSISTSPGIRGGNTDMGLSIATPPGRRRESGCDFARATASIRRGSRTMQSFGSGEARHLLHLPHNADTHMWHMYLWVGVADEPQEEGERCVSVSESSPPQGGPWQGTCPPCAQGSKIWGSWGLLGGRGFHSMVLETNKAERGGNSSGGQEANLGLGGDSSRSQSVPLACVLVLRTTVQDLISRRTASAPDYPPIRPKQKQCPA